MQRQPFAELGRDLRNRASNSSSPSKAERVGATAPHSLARGYTAAQLNLEREQSSGSEEGLQGWVEHDTLWGSTYTAGSSLEGSPPPGTEAGAGSAQHEELGPPNTVLIYRLASEVGHADTVSASYVAGSSLEGSPPLAAGAGAGSTQHEELGPPNTALINRLASEVANAEVVSAWEQVEELREELRHKDAELHLALDAIERLQQQQPAAALPPPAQPQSAGQQLAQTLRESLRQKDEDLQAAQLAAAALQQQLAERTAEVAAADLRCQAVAQRAEETDATLQDAHLQLAAANRERAALREELHAMQAYADEQTEAASLARLELQEVQEAANAQIHQLQQELWAAEARLQLASYGATPDTVEQPQQYQPQESQSQQSAPLRQSAPATDFHSAPSSPVLDVFGSPQPARPPSGGQAEEQQQQQQQVAPTAGSASFQFQPLLGPDPAAEQQGSMDASPGVPEAALVARTLRRGGARAREEAAEVQEGLAQLKQMHRQVHAQLAEAQPLQKEQPRGRALAVAGGGNSRAQTPRSGTPRGRQEEALPLEEQCRFQQLEERQLREEIAALNSKCEKSNQTLLKANQAMKILHYKLQKERKIVARLQDEKCQLQSELLEAKTGNGCQQELQESILRLGQLEQEKEALEARLGAMQAEQARLVEEAQERCSQLAAELEKQQAVAVAQLEHQQAAAASELAQLSEVAHSSTDELMQAREALQQERSRAEALMQERAELHGKVEALQDTLRSQGRSEDTLLQLTEQKASLLLQLRDAQASTAISHSELAKQSAYVSELEQACQSLRAQLDAALSQHAAAHMAVEAAADRLQQMADSQEGLEQQLEQAQQASSAATAQAQAYAAQLQQQGHELEELRQRVGEVAAERDRLAADVQQFAGHNAQMREAVQDLQAECAAARSQGAKAEAENLTLVDNMCDMTGLIDAVQALQQRNRLLQQDLDGWKARHQELQIALEAKSQQHLGALTELQGSKDALTETQQALAAADERAEGLASRVQAVEGQAQELQEKLAQSESSLAKLTAEQQAWEAKRAELQGQLAAAKKAQALAQSKLVLARQRETHLKEAAQQFDSLQADLKGYLEECEVVKMQKEAADERCAVLERRCGSLEQNDKQLNERLAAAQEENTQLKEANLALEERLARLQLAHAQLEQQLISSQGLTQRLSQLESEQQSSSEWFDALNAEVAEKTAELAAAREQLAASQLTQAQAAEQLRAVEHRLAETQQAQQDAEAGWQAASAALREMEGQLAAARQQCEALSGQERDAAREAAAMAAARQSAEQRAAELEQEHAGLQAECTSLRQQLEALASARDSEVSELQKQAAHLSRERRELSERLEAAVAEHHQELARVQAALEESLAARDSLTSELAAAEDVLQEAEQREQCAASQASQLQGQLAEAEAARGALQAQRDSLAAQAEQQAQRLDQLQQQCAVLTQQLASMQAQWEGAMDQLQNVLAELSDAQAQRRQLHEQLEDAIDARHTAQQSAAEAEQHAASLERRVSELFGQLEALQGELAGAQAAAQQAQQALDEATAAREAEVGALREQLQQAQAAAAEAVPFRQEEDADERSQGKDEVRAMLQDVSSKLEAQMEVLQRVEDAAASRMAAGEEGSCASPATGTPRAASARLNPSQALARRELLVQALERLQALQAENQHLWHMVESQLAHSGPAAAASSQPSVLMYANAGMQQAEMAAQLAAAQATIEQLQRRVEQLSIAQHAQHSMPASSSASYGTCLDHASWQAEKMVLKAICKLALAVTMDQVGGRRDAAALAEELGPLMRAHEASLNQLSLFKVWKSLHKLAIAAPRSNQPLPPTPPQPCPQCGAAAAAAAALQQQVTHYRGRCRELEHRMANLEAATTRWQGQADEVEQALALLRFQLEDLLSEIKWVLADYSEDDARPGNARAEEGVSQQLGQVVTALSKALHRLLRKHRTLSSLLAHPGTAHPRQQASGLQQQQHHHHRELEQPGVGDRHGHGWSQAAASSSNGGGATSSGAHPPERENCSHAGNGELFGQGGASEQLVAAARGKAASIAQKLDRLLTPHSRAVLHGGGSRGLLGPSQRDSSSAGVAAGGHWDSGGLWAGAVTGGISSGGRLLGTMGEEGDDEVPLRQRYGTRSVQ